MFKMPRITGLLTTHKRFLWNWLDKECKLWGQYIPNKDEVHLPPGMSRSSWYEGYCAAWKEACSNTVGFLHMAMQPDSWSKDKLDPQKVPMPTNDPGNTPLRYANIYDP
jgi:hypothetical protein